jgi:hypothetical protein
MAAKLKIEKRGMKFKKSSLKLQSQSQPNFIKFGCGGHLGRRSERSDINLEGNHPRIISAKFG